MSLELALAENTAALHALLAHLQSGLALRQPTPEEVDANIKALNAAQAQEAPKPQAASKRGTAAATTAAPAPTPPTAEAAVDAAPAKTAGASTPAAASAAAAAPASTAATDPAPDYATTARAINDLVKACGRQAAVDVLAQFGADTLKAVKPEQFAAVVAACAEASKVAA